jgi:hypothetical protein
MLWFGSVGFWFGYGLVVSGFGLWYDLVVLDFSLVKFSALVIV